MVEGAREKLNMKQEIPAYILDERYRHIHRTKDPLPAFGYNTLDPSLRIKDLELYSSEGLVSSMCCSIPHFSNRWRLRFSEPSSFHRFFRKATDRTPAEYRSGDRTMHK
jgi:hypothetical protein